MEAERLNEITKNNSPILFIVDEEPSTFRVIGKHFNITGGSSNLPSFNLAYNRTHIAFSSVYSVIMYSGQQKVHFLAEMVIDCKNLNKSNVGKNASSIIMKNLNIISVKY